MRLNGEHGRRLRTSRGYRIVRRNRLPGRSFPAKAGRRNRQPKWRAARDRDRYGIGKQSSVVMHLASVGLIEKRDRNQRTAAHPQNSRKIHKRGVCRVIREPAPQSPDRHLPPVADLSAMKEKIAVGNVRRQLQIRSVSPSPLRGRERLSI